MVDEGRASVTSGVAEAFSRFFRRAPRQARSRALVQAMLSALEEQLSDDADSRGWTIEAVLDRAGVGIGSFYEYFSTKESVLGALVGAVTERNFRELLAISEVEPEDSLETAISRMATEVARAYLGRPAFTRAVVATIARLGLMRPVAVARDRFATELAKRAHRFFPSSTEEELAETMRMIADAIMGMISGELDRTAQPDVAAFATRINDLGRLLLRSRHQPVSVAPQQSVGEVPE